MCIRVRICPLVAPCKLHCPTRPVCCVSRWWRRRPRWEISLNVVPPSAALAGGVPASRRRLVSKKLRHCFVLPGAQCDQKHRWGPDSGGARVGPRGRVRRRQFEPERGYRRHPTRHARVRSTAHGNSHSECMEQVQSSSFGSVVLCLAVYSPELQLDWRTTAGADTDSSNGII